MLWVFNVVHVTRTSPTERKTRQKKKVNKKIWELRMMLLHKNSASTPIDRFPCTSAAPPVKTKTQTPSGVIGRYTHKRPGFNSSAKFWRSNVDVFSKGFINSSVWHLSFLQTIPKTRIPELSSFYSLVTEQLLMWYMLQINKITTLQDFFWALISTDLSCPAVWLL